MNRACVGRSGVTLTALGFGGASLGNLYSEVAEETAQQALDAAWDEGIRYFDTAPHYGLGLSERRIGRALRGRPRDQYVISTKVGRLLVPNAAPTGSDLRGGGFAVPDMLTRCRDYSRDGVLRSLEASLERLGLDHVDIVLVHDPEDYMDEALSAAVPALIELREQGVIGAVGAGMNLVAPLQRFVRETDVDLVLIAGRWTLVDQSAAPLLDDCSEHGVGLVAAGVFNSGLLSAGEPADDARFDYRRAPAQVLAAARTCARVCEAHGTSLPVAALQFPLRHPGVRAILVGMRSAEECTQDVAALSARLDDRLWRELPPAVR
ncbi:MAG TPA: aldo/keto reductase [Solirubrobacteraceae bacterium]|jgi:D-threo-aldose 1-dehydrogenase|nr:aldo/keto reductase [Solirubrobacteraceae bacterium]